MHWETTLLTNENSARGGTGVAGSGWVLWPIVLLILLANGLKLFQQPLQTDVAWYLYIGKDLLEGKRLYVDILENNPPLICYLNVLPNWIAAVLHLDVKPVWIVLVSLALSTPAVLALVLLERLKLVWGWRRTLTGILLVGVSVAAGSLFGERDHLAFAAMIPVLVLAANRIAGVHVPRWMVFLVSGWAGVCLAFKPYFLIPWFLVTLYMAVQLKGRVLRLPESYIIPMGTLLHVLAIPIFTPAYVGIARLAADWYGGYNTSRQVIIHALLAPIGGVVLAACYRPGVLYRSLIHLNGLAMLGWILSAILQQKGNDYHLFPALASLSVFLYLIVLDLWSRDVWREIFSISTGVAGVLAFVLIAENTTVEIRRLRTGYFYDTEVLLPYLRASSHERVVFLSTALIAFPTANETGVVFGNSYPCLWTVPGIYAAETRNLGPGGRLAFHDLATMPAAERDVFDRTYSDMMRKPRLIVVDTHARKWAMRDAVFDLESYFQRDERLRKIWSEYDELPPVENFRVYRRR